MSPSGLIGRPIFQTKTDEDIGLHRYWINSAVTVRLLFR
jgi:hypothetical protein